ncbi:hypothetical protein [Caudoviricetes sp.]|nr:hypothetical protein [Caudoviricetes sp.]UOF80997.1 hypothetical protein [Caudoviricetes sp.]UOF81393.1 hypothetical protein [Caudoviricetes sp.]
MGSSKAPSPPTIIQQAPAAPPPATQTAREALQAELEYRPQFREQDIQDILQLGKAAADLQTQQAIPLARAQRAALEEMEPETYAALQAAGKQVLGQLESPLSPELQNYYRDIFRSEEAAQGRLGSAVGSETIANKLALLREQNRQNALSSALSLGGRAPLGISELGSQRTSPFGSFVSPFLNQASNTYATGAGIYGSQLGAATNIYGIQSGNVNARNANRTQLIGAGIGALGNVGGAFLGRPPGTP